MTLFVARAGNDEVDRQTRAVRTHEGPAAFIGPSGEGMLRERSEAARSCSTVRLRKFASARVDLAGQVPEQRGTFANDVLRTISEHELGAAVEHLYEAIQVGGDDRDTRCRVENVAQLRVL